MFSVFEAPHEQDEPDGHSRTVLCDPKAFTERSHAYAWISTINVATSETGSSHILVRVKLPNCRKYTLV
jgi:hypothetical protein